jgi:CelD/BcsL family acetyltransferase involved in cellulose biosynthesis
MAAIRFAIDRGCQTFDLLRGDEPYKANWRAVPTPCYDLRVWPRRCEGLLEWFAWEGYTRVVRWLKPLIPQSVVHRGLTLLRAMKKI